MSINDNLQEEQEFSFKRFFVPLTTLKAIHWIVIIGIIVYFNILFNGFVWDDLVYTIGNPAIQKFDLFSLFGANQRFNGEGFYRPIPAIYLSILWNIFGNMSFFYHFIQLVLQITCSILFFFFLKKFFRISLSFFLALIFLFHPMQVESVAYISSAQNNLFFLFGIAALLIAMQENFSAKKFLFFSLLLLLSLLTKETGFLFILVIFLYLFFYKRQQFFAFVPYVVMVSFIYTLLRFGYAHNFFTRNPQIPIATLSFSERLINIPAVFFYYISTFFYPVHLTIDQQWVITAITSQQFYLPLFIDLFFVMVLFVLGIFIYKKRKQFFNLYLFSTIWFIAGIGLVMQFVPLDATVSDRWFYFPIAGVLIIIGVIFSIIQTQKEIIKRLLIGIAIVYICLLGIRTMVRNTNYVDQFTLFSHDTTVAEKSFDLENQLAIMYYQKGNREEARKHFQKSITLMPCTDAPSNLAILDQEMGNLQDAAQNYRKVVNCRGKFEDFQNLVLVLYQQNDLDRIAYFAKKGIQKYPQGAGLYYMLGIVEAKRNNKQDALKNLEYAYELTPNQKISDAINQVKNNQPVNLQ